MKKWFLVVLFVFIVLPVFAFSEEQKNIFEEAVKEFSSSDPYTKISAIEKFIVSKDIRAVQYLKKALKDKNTFVRQRALDALGALRAKEVVSDITEVLLKDTDPSVKQAAVGALGVIGSLEALPILHQVLKDTTTPVFVRYAICEKLKIFRSPTSVPVLKDLLTETDVKLRRSVVMALNSIDSPEILPILRNLLKEEKDEDFICDILLYLTNRQDKESLPKVKPYLTSPSEKIKIYAAVFAAKVAQDSESLSILKKNLEHSNPVIKSLIVDAIGFVGDKNILETLKSLFEKESDFYIKEMIKISISRIENRLPKETAPTGQKNTKPPVKKN